MKGWSTSLLLFIAFAIVLVLGIMYPHDSLFKIALLVIVAIRLCLVLFAARKKEWAKDTGGKYDLQKISNAIIIISAFGVLTATVFIVFHQRGVGRQILNYSLLLSLTGFIALTISMAKPSTAALSPVLKRQRVGNIVTCLCVVCVIAGLMLRIHHYTWGRFVVNGGIAAMLFFLLFVIIYTKYGKGGNNAS